MSKSLFLSYVLWLFGGILGLHHFYLRRDAHAFVWFTTFGGWWFGWIRDFFKLPTYVEEANIDNEPNRTFSKTKSKISGTRYLGAVMLGVFYSFLLRILIPEELVEKHQWLKFTAKLLAPIGASFGVYLVMNIGREVAPYMSALKGAFVVFPLTLYQDETSYIFHMSAASLISVCYYGTHYVTSPRPSAPLCKRVLRFNLGASVFIAILVIIALYNVSVTTESGETVPLKTAVHNFFHSEAWRKTRSTGWYLYDYWRRHGWDKLWREMKMKLDPSGLGYAYEVLEISESMTEEQITKQYRKMSRRWHPDKFTSPDEKAYAQEQFIEIQSAWEKVSSLKYKREIKNRRSRRDEF